MRHTETLIINKDDKLKIKEAALALKEGAVVSIPTETVYGLGANAFLPDSVNEIFKVKGRPSDNPLIVHIAELSEAKEIGRDIPEVFYTLAEKFWPGPLSMIVKKSDKIPENVSAGLDTIAIRMPDMEITREFIKYAGCPVAAPSANISGTVSATSAEFVYDDFAGRIPYIIDGGASDVGIESTVLDLTKEVPVILRPGGITKEDFESVGVEVCYHPSLLSGGEVEKPASPGMKYKHYSPSCPVILVCGNTGLAQDYILRNIKNDECVFAFLEQKELLKLQNSICLSSVKEPYKAAAKIFDELRKADKKGYKKIYLTSLPEKGMGISYMNRVKKSAGGNIKRLDKIILVCTGNTCRSPMAEYIFRTAAPSLSVISRGLAVGSSSKMSWYSEKILQSYGMDTKDFISAPLTLKEAEEADIIYTMTNDHREAILASHPEFEDKVFTLKINGDVKDPYMGSEEIYEETFREILREARRIISDD